MLYPPRILDSGSQKRNNSAADAKKFVLGMAIIAIGLFGYGLFVFITTGGDFITFRDPDPPFIYGGF